LPGVQLSAGRGATIATMPDRVGFANLTLDQFVDRLASDEPVPGGGSASALAGALAGALLSMVCRLSLDRPKYEPYRSSIERALEVGERARRSLLALADEDAAAYAAFVAARKLPRDTPDEEAARAAATQAAARRASEAPLAVARECARLMEAIGAVAGRSNLNAASDIEVAARLCAAAARGAAANVRINLPAVGDPRFTGGVTAELEGLLHGVDREAAEVSQRVARGELRGPEPG
jgi:formiminotetrahydrofolate cyclodeaminase